MSSKSNGLALLSATTVAAMFLASLSGAAGAAPGAPPASQPAASQPATGATVMKLTLRSPAFENGKPIPKKHTGEGEDVSPELTWSDVPAGTVELALLVDDPDAPVGDWVHWVIYKIPATAKGLKAGVSRDQRPKEPAGALQGKNSWGTIGYRGPMPPPGHGVHHYHFKLYALDAALDLQPGLTKEDLLKSIKGHIIGQGELIGTYQR